MARVEWPSPIEEEFHDSLIVLAETRGFVVHDYIAVLLIDELTAWFAGRMDAGSTAEPTIHGSTESTRKLRVYPQCWVGEHYTADFVLVAESVDDDRRVCMAVECDGRDFHDSTRDQWVHDRVRDRAFAGVDLPVMRYAGREIRRDSLGCASEVLNELCRRFGAS